MARYVHILDERDYEQLDAVFTPDAMFDLTSARGIRDAWSVVKPWYARSLHGFLDYFHLIGSIRIAFEPDRRTAFTKSKVINPCGTLGEDGEIHHFETFGFCTGVWTKPPDGSRISERTWIHRWIRGDYPLANGPGEF